MASVVWPYMPLMQVAELLTWRTALHERPAVDMRWSLRAARQLFRLPFSFALEDYETARFLFRSNILGDWDVPVWTEATEGVDVGSADTSITVDTNAEYVAGGKAIIWSSPVNYTVVTVDAVTATGINLSAAVGANHTAALVMPLRTCLARSGLSDAKIGDDFWTVEIEFEARDNPDLTTLNVEPLEVTFAIDTSRSMDAKVALDITRLDVARATVIEALKYLEATGAAHDVHVIGFDNSNSSLIRNAATPTDYAALRSHVSGLTTAHGTDFGEAFASSSTFYDGTVRRLFFFLTDGLPTDPATVTDAVTARDLISDIEVFGLQIGEIDTTHTDQVDNQDGAFITQDHGFSILDLIVPSLLGFDSARGRALLPTADRALEELSGDIVRAAIFVDSGLGTVTVEPTRSIIEDSVSAAVRPQNAAERFKFKRLMHFLAGRDRPLFLPDFRLPILASTTTTVDVAPVRQDAADWIGDVVLLDDQARAITGGVLSGSSHRLTFDALAAAPTGKAVRLRQVRGLSDAVELAHIRGRWATTRLGFVDAPDTQVPYDRLQLVDVSAISRFIGLRTPARPEVAAISRFIGMRALDDTRIAAISRFIGMRTS